MINKPLIPIKLAIFCLFLVTLVSCSSEVESLEDRSLARWYSLIDKDWEKAYLFETPDYRKTYPIERYKNNFGESVEWNSIEFVSIKKISENVADVNLSLHVTYNTNLPFDSPLTERWIFEQGKWWHVQNKQ